jgi:hypothetical protein
MVAMGFSSSSLLAIRSHADRLLGMESGKAEETLAESARPLEHSSRVARFCFNQTYAGMV